MVSMSIHVSLSPRAYCHSDLVIEHVYHEVEADSLLPVNVRIAYGQLLAVPPPHLHKVALTRALLPETQSFSVKDKRGYYRFTGQRREGHRCQCSGQTERGSVGRRGLSSRSCSWCMRTRGPGNIYHFKTEESLNFPTFFRNLIGMPGI